MVGPDFHQALSQAGIGNARIAIQSNDSGNSSKSKEAVESGVENKVSMRGSAGVHDSAYHLGRSGKSAVATATVDTAARLSKSDKNVVPLVGQDSISNSDALPATTATAVSLPPEVSLPVLSGSCVTADAQASLTIQRAYGGDSFNQSTDAAVENGEQLQLPGFNSSLEGSDVGGLERVSSEMSGNGSADAAGATQKDSGAGSCESSQSAEILNTSSDELFDAAVVPETTSLPPFNPPVVGSASEKLVEPKRMDADTSGRGGGKTLSALANLEGRDSLKTVNELIPAVPLSGAGIKDQPAPVTAIAYAHQPAASDPSVNNHMVAGEVQSTPAAVDPSSSPASILTDTIPAATTELTGASLTNSSGSSGSSGSFSNLASSSVTAVPASSANSAIKTSDLGSVTGSLRGKLTPDLRSGSNRQAAAADGSQAPNLRGDLQVTGSGSNSQTSVDAGSSHGNMSPEAALNQQNTVPVQPNIQTAPVELSSPTQPSIHNNDSSSSSASPAPAPTDNGSLAAQATSSVNNAQLIQSMHHSEMRLGLHSTEFGNLSISTSLNRQALSAQISTDHAELGRALAMHLPAMQEKLGNAYGMQARVEIRDGGSSSSYSNAGQQSKENRQDQPQGLAGSTMTRLESSGVSTNSTTAPMYADSSRLDIRV